MATVLMRPETFSSPLPGRKNAFQRLQAHGVNAQASTLPVAGLTAWFALVEQGHLKAGDTVFLPGTGGVAIFALQIAVAHGAKVVISSSSDEKLGRARKLGAAHCLHRGSSDVVAQTLNITSSRGVDHILELVGGDNSSNRSRWLRLAVLSPSSTFEGRWS